MSSVYKIIKSEEELDRVISYCKKTKYASIDFEDSGHGQMHPLCYPTIMGISFQPGSAYILPMGHFDSPFKDDYKRLFLKFSKEVLENPDIVKVAWNAKYEYVWIKNLGGKIVGRYFDAMLAKYLLNEERPNDLKSMVDRYIPEFAGYEEKYEGSKLPWDKKPLEGLSKYCGLDCDNTLRLMIFFEKQLIKNDFYKLFRNMLMMATFVLGDSEHQGMFVDRDYLENLMVKYEGLIVKSEEALRNNKYIRKYEKWLQEQRIEKLINKVELEIEDLEEELEDAINEGDQKKINSKNKSIKGRQEKIDRYRAKELVTKKELEVLNPVNFNSPAQMGELFFTSPKGFKFEIIKYTTDKQKNETNNPSTDEEVLLALEKIDKTGFCTELLNHRGLTTLYGTFIKGMYERLTPNNKVHGRFLLHGTVTGRLSCVSGDTIVKLYDNEIKIKDICPDNKGYKDISHLGLKALTHNN